MIRRAASAAACWCWPRRLCRAGWGSDESFRQLRPEEVPFEPERVVDRAADDHDDVHDDRRHHVAAAPRAAVTTVATTTTSRGAAVPTHAVLRARRQAGGGHPVRADPAARRRRDRRSRRRGSRPTDRPTGLRACCARARGVRGDRRRRGPGGLTLDFGEKLPAGEQQLALAQLVFTLTALPGIGQVVFERGGVPIDVPRSDGSLVSGVITREDFAGVLGR